MLSLKLVQTGLELFLKEKYGFPKSSLKTLRKNTR